MNELTPVTPKRRTLLRTLKYSLLIACISLTCLYCGDTKPKPDAFASIKRNKKIRIATSPFNIPFETAGAKGVEGYDVDLGAEIAKDISAGLSKEIEYPADWIIVKDSLEKMFEYLETGQVEMVISSVAITDARKQRFAFSTPYFDSSNTIARRQDHLEIKDLASLTGKRVGVQTGRTAEEFMANQKTAANVTLSRYQTLDEALGFLNRGEIDAVVGDKPIMTYSIAKNYSTNLITTDVDLMTMQYAVVVRPEETKLLAQINDTIARLKNSNQLQVWYDSWIGDVLKEMGSKVSEINKTEQLKTQPKMLSVTFFKEAGNTQIQLDRLDGFNATLSGPGGAFTSTAIYTDDAGVKGNCKFTSPVPPGEYRFNLSRLQVSQAVTIEKRPVTSMTVALTFTKSNSLVIDVK